MDDTEKLGPGRPRDTRSRQAILAAALELLDERGYAGLSIEAVAKRAHTGKTTLYRWWPSRAAIVVEAFFDATVAELALGNTNAAADDFRHQLKQLARLFRIGRGRSLASLIIGSHHDADLRTALDERWFQPRKRWGRERMRLAVEQGQCVPNLAVFTALDALYSPLYSRLLQGAKVHTDEEVDRHFDLLFPAIFVRAVCPASPPSSAP